MRSSIRVAPGIAAALVLVVLVIVKLGEAAEAVGRTAVRCQRAVTVAGQAFTARQLSDLGRCVGAAMSCAETRSGDVECLAEAGTRCDRMVARILRREHKLARLIAGRCAAVDHEQLLAPTGLGFARLAPLCPALGTGRGDATVLGTCLAGLRRCRGEGLFATTVPRAGELLRVAGVPATARAALSCMPDHGGTGRGERDPEAGAAITRCTRTMARAAARLVTRTLANVSLCTRATEACLEGSDDESACLTAASTTCGAAFARVAGARVAFGRAVGAVCGEEQIAFATLAAPTGADLEALGDGCAVVEVDTVRTLPALAECVARRHECELSALVEEATPRAAELLAQVDQTVARAYCAASAPSERPTPTPTAIGPTRTPRPGDTPTPTPQPTATPFCGDGVIDDGEECDGDALDDNTCEDLCLESDPDGVLVCAACRFDFGDCRGVDCVAP